MTDENLKNIERKVKSTTKNRWKQFPRSIYNNPDIYDSRDPFGEGDDLKYALRIIKKQGSIGGYTI
jgi:hypothetical protein